MVPFVNVDALLGGRSQIMHADPGCSLSHPRKRRRAN
jgi:hypothetical protein